MQTDLFPSTPQTYVGWFRPVEGVWEPVCSAETAQDCWRLLLQHKPLAVQACEKVVKAKGEKP